MPEGKLTEATVLDLLQRSHTRDGNGGSGEYAFLRHVRNGAGFEANRTLDAVAVSLWRSRGLAIEGFEVKVDRRDWLKELRSPEKMDAVAPMVDRFTVVAPAAVVKAGEVPDTWGLIEVSATGTRLRRRKEAPLLHGKVGKTVSRGVLVAMLRAAGAHAVREVLPGCYSQEEHDAALGQAREEGRAQERRCALEVRAHAAEAQRRYDELKRELHGSAYAEHDELVALVRRVAGDEAAARAAREQLRWVRNQLARQLAAVEQALA